MTFSITGLDHVQVAAPAGCEDAARAFYGGLLGMPEIPKPASLAGRGGCWFVCGHQEIHVGVEAEFAPAKKAHPGFTVQGLAELRARLEANGALVKEEPPIAGRARFFVSDPFGNRIEFLEYT